MPRIPLPVPTSHNARLRGNIGVTTSQQMLQSERDIVQFDFIGHVANIVNDAACTSFWEEDDKGNRPH